MSLSMYQASVPVLLRGLNVLATLLAKAEQHAEAGGIVPDLLLGARLAPDMLTLTGQVQRASDTAKLSGERLSGVAAPRFPDDETSFAQLQQRLADTIAYLAGIAPAALEAWATRTISLNFGALQPNFSAEQYLLTFALPNFFFHVATAHGILRQQGVQIGKLDYLGPYQ